jgi:subtilisin family serine protease
MPNHPSNDRCPPGAQLFVARAVLACLGLAVASCGAPDHDAATAEAAVTGGTSYLVLYRAAAVPANAAAVIKAAGGALVTSYPSLGVALARSTSAGFRGALAANSAVEGVAATSGLATKIDTGSKATATVPHLTAPAASGDPLTSLQWDMTQIHAAQARAVTSGASSVLVAVMDSGVDNTHVDLATQIDAGASASCVGGTANTDPAQWGFDFIGHGTHVAGIIAGARNGVGIVGVAPGVKIASIKVADDNGFIYPEALVCAMNWAVAHHVDVANASFFTDPWYFNCKNDPVQRAIWKAEQRAINAALQSGMTVIAATSNEEIDLAHPTVDPFSPTDGPTVPREVHNDCALLPVEISGVIGVGAVGATRIKSFYANYGIGVVDVTGPGGDQFIMTAEAETGQVVSAIPSYSLLYQLAPMWNGAYTDCTGSPDTAHCATYAALQGTSFAAPHVAGIAALIISRFGRMSPGAMAARLQQAAAPIACPPNPFIASDGSSQICEGSAANNGFYGAGEVDALAAVR